MAFQPGVPFNLPGGAGTGIWKQVPMGAGGQPPSGTAGFQGKYYKLTRNTGPAAGLPTPMGGAAPPVTPSVPAPAPPSNPSFPTGGPTGGPPINSAPNSGVIPLGGGPTWYPTPSPYNTPLWSPHGAMVPPQGPLPTSNIPGQPLGGMPGPSPGMGPGMAPGMAPGTMSNPNTGYTLQDVLAGNYSGGQSPDQQAFLNYQNQMPGGGPGGTPGVYGNNWTNTQWF